MPINKYLPRPVVIGFVILAGFCGFGIHQASQNAQETKKIAANVQAASKKETQDVCDAVNQGRAAAVKAQKNAAKVQVAQAEGLLARLEQAGKLNPPQTDQAKKSQQAGVEFFGQLVEDTKMLTKQGEVELRREIPLIKCES